MDLTTARVIIDGAQEYGREHGLAPLTIAVLDRGGHVVAAERQDGSANKRFEIAFGKAHGAISLGLGSRALFERAQQQPFFIAAANDAIGPLIPVPGGVLVTTAEGQLIGAVGISGDTSDNDEAAAVAGASAAGLAAVVGAT